MYLDKITAISTLYYRIINMSNRILRVSLRSILAGCIACSIASFLLIATQPGAPHATTMTGHSVSMVRIRFSILESVFANVKRLFGGRYTPH